MPTKRELKSLIEEGKNLKEITSSYAEISAIKLRKIRNKIEHNQNFVKEISKLFYIVREEAIRRKIFPKIKFEGTVHIVITSNYPFYGSLEGRLLRDYLKKADLLSPKLRIIIGKTGNYFLKSINFKLPFEKFILRKDIPSLKELEELTKKIRPFKNILVFYSIFDSLLIQKPTFTNLTKPFSLEKKLIEKREIYHIFEPEIEDMFFFFNNQIIQILLEQTFLESELSRTASRLITMNEAQEKAESFIRSQIKKIKIVEKNLINFKFLDIFYPSQKWREKVYYGR